MSGNVRPGSGWAPTTSRDLVYDLWRTNNYLHRCSDHSVFTTGSVLGFMAVVIGGWFDVLLSRFVDLIMSIPGLIFALVILSAVPASIFILILVMAFLDATRVYRLSRSVAESIHVMDYIEVAKLRGEQAGLYS